MDAGAGECSDPDKTNLELESCVLQTGSRKHPKKQWRRQSVPMTTLNKYASEVVRKYQVHGCTDVTGFGFLGHLLEMLGDAYSARVESSQVPYIPEAFDYAGEVLP